MAALTHVISTPTAPPPHDLPKSERPHREMGLQVIRRNGTFSPFDAGNIKLAITKAFVAVEGSEATASRRIRSAVESMTQQVVHTLSRRAEPGRPIHIEDIQDQVELALMRSGEHKVARAYVLYREERGQERRKREEQEAGVALPRLHVRLSDGLQEPLDEKQLYRDISEACAGLDAVSAESVMSEVPSITEKAAWAFAYTLVAGEYLK